MSLVDFQASFETPLTTQAQVDALSQRYHDKIQSLHIALRALQSTRNDLAPVSRLPPEILGEIFVSVVRSYAQHEYFNTFSTKTVDWLGMTQVCRRWRQVALACSRVWSFIPLQHRYLTLIRTLLERSRRAPLTMIQPNVKEEDLPFALENIAFAHMDRVKTFAVVLTRSALVRARKCAGLDAPFLTALTVAVDDYREGDSLVWLTQASWPHLRSLECHYGTVRHLQALLRPTLTSLIVEYIEPCVTVEVLLDLLSGLPHLTTLKILHCLTPIDSLPTAPPGSSAPIVSLPQLRFFEIGEGAVGISEAHLLNHLKFSSNTEVHFSNQVSSTLADISYIVSAFVAKASGVPGSMGSAKAFKVEEWLFFGTKISVYSQVVPDFWDRGEHILWDLERLSPTATLGLMGSQQDVVSSFISQYPLSDVHSVCCRSSELDEMEPWHLLAQLPSVQELHLEHTPRTAFACFLECLKEQHTFSSLQFLRLSHIVWNKCHSSARRQDMRVGSLVPPLLRAIKYRQQHGPRLHTLQLPYAINLFENDDEDLERLSRMVDKFRCSDWEDPDEPDECSTCYSSGSEGETASDAEGSSDEDPETDETDTSDDLDADGEEEP